MKAHGTQGRYSKGPDVEGNPRGCRCRPCRDAQAQYMRGWRRRSATGVCTPRTFVPAAGSKRRLQALMTQGHSLAALGRRVARDDTLHRVMRARFVYAYTADAIKRVYDELWDVPAVGPVAHKTRNLARRRGYPPPMAWDDETIDDPDARPARWRGQALKGLDPVAVDLAVSTQGKWPSLTRDERWQAFLRLHKRGMSQRQISWWLGCDIRNIQRYALALRSAA